MILLFQEVLNYVSRVDRVLSFPGGSLLLAGRSGVGRRTVTSLVSHMHGAFLITPKISRGYELKQFRNDLKHVSNSVFCNLKFVHMHLKKQWEFWRTVVLRERDFKKSIMSVVWMKQIFKCSCVDLHTVLYFPETILLSISTLFLSVVDLKFISRLYECWKLFFVCMLSYSVSTMVCLLIG